MPINVDDIVIGPKVQDDTRKPLQSALESIRALTRALEAGGYSVAPGASQEGQALKFESLDATMKAVTFDSKHIKFGKPLIPFKRADDGPYFRYTTMAVATPRKNVIIDSSFPEDLVIVHEPVQSPTGFEIVRPGPDAWATDDVVAAGGGSTLTQKMLEDTVVHIRARSDQMVMDQLVVDPKVLAAYNKITFKMERITPSESAMFFPPGYWDKCGKCNVTSVGGFVAAELKPLTRAAREMLALVAR